jgi:hypothetical protein
VTTPDCLPHQVAIWCACDSGKSRSSTT